MLYLESKQVCVYCDMSWCNSSRYVSDIQRDSISRKSLYESNMKLFDLHPHSVIKFLTKEGNKQGIHKRMAAVYGESTLSYHPLHSMLSKQFKWDRKSTEDKKDSQQTYTYFTCQCTCRGKLTLRVSATGLSALAWLPWIISCFELRRNFFVGSVL